MTLNEITEKVFNYAEKQGFHENNDFGRSLMLVVSELSEALEADRQGKYFIPNGNPTALMSKAEYEVYVKGTVEEEIADAVIRLCDIAGIWGINLDWHVKAKMVYNETRPYKHGKKY